MLPWSRYPSNTALTLKNGTVRTILKDPAGWGYLLYPPPAEMHTTGSWTPVESVRWVMSGAGIQDAEYLYALEKKASPLSAKASALLAQARTLATHFPLGWNRRCSGGGKVGPDGKKVADWGDDGYVVDKGGQADGSSVVNEWRLAMGAELDKTLEIHQHHPLSTKTDDTSSVTISHTGDGLPISTVNGSFPMGVWLQEPRLAQRYKDAVGANLFIGPSWRNVIVHRSNLELLVLAS